jgi:hypothetical protein
MATLLPALRAWRRPLVAGAAACLLLWQALTLAVFAPARGPHSAEGAATVADALCAARAADGGRAPAHPDPGRHCLLCAFGARDASPALLALAAIVLAAWAPSASATAAPFADAPRLAPPRRAGSWSPRAPPSMV